MNRPAASPLKIENGAITLIPDTFTPDTNHQVVYEVFRVDQTYSVFLEDHLNRLFKSITTIYKKSSIGANDLKRLLIDYIQKSRVEFGNVKIEFIFTSDVESELYFRAYFIPTSYPDSKMYREGVVCNVLNAERKSPSVKMANPELRQLSDSIIKKEKVYETILVNKDGFITECSRSNLFLIKTGVIYTAPDYMVLSGIIRQKVLKIIKDHQLPVIMEAVNINDLPLYEACFITGTSPRVLPVRQIGDIRFNVSNTLIYNIHNLLNQLIFNHINQQE